MRQPTASPVAISTTMRLTWVTRSASVRPARTAEREIGSERNRSIRRGAAQSGFAAWRARLADSSGAVSASRTAPARSAAG